MSESIPSIFKKDRREQFDLFHDRIDLLITKNDRFDRNTDDQIPNSESVWVHFNGDLSELFTNSCIFGGKFSQHFLAQNWADSSSHSLSISTFSPDTQRIQNRVRKAVCFFNKCNNDLTRYKSLGSDCETANKFHYRPVKKTRSRLFCPKKRSLCAGSPRTTQPGWWWGTAAPPRRTPAAQAAPPYSFFLLKGTVSRDFPTFPEPLMNTEY